MYGLLRIFLYMSIYIFISILSYLIVIIISGKKGRIFILNLNYNSRLKKVNVVYTSESKHYNFIIFCNEPFDSDIWFLLPDCIKWFYFFFKSRTVLISFCTKCNSFSKLSSSIYWVFLQALFYLYMYTSTYVYIMRFVK